MVVNQNDIEKVKFQKGGMYKGVSFKTDGFTYSIVLNGKTQYFKTLQDTIDYIDDCKGGNYVYLQN